MPASKTSSQSHVPNASSFLNSLQMASCASCCLKRGSLLFMFSVMQADHSNCWDLFRCGCVSSVSRLARHRLFRGAEGDEGLLLVSRAGKGKVGMLILLKLLLLFSVALSAGAAVRGSTSEPCCLPRGSTRLGVTSSLLFLLVKRGGETFCVSPLPSWLFGFLADGQCPTEGSTSGRLPRWQRNPAMGHPRWVKH